MRGVEALLQTARCACSPPLPYSSTDCEKSGNARGNETRERASRGPQSVVISGHQRSSMRREMAIGPVSYAKGQAGLSATQLRNPRRAPWRAHQRTHLIQLCSGGSAMSTTERRPRQLAHDANVLKRKAERAQPRTLSVSYGRSGSEQLGWPKRRPLKRGMAQPPCSHGASGASDTSPARTTCPARVGPS